MTSGSEGIGNYYPTNTIGDSVDKFEDTLYYTEEPSGWTENTDIDVSWNPVTRKVTLSGNSLGVYRGVVIVDLADGDFVSPEHSATPTASVPLYLTYDGTSWGWREGTGYDHSDLVAAAIIVNSSGAAVMATRECHGFMQHESLSHFHLAIGTLCTGGGDISGLVLDSTTADDRRPLVSDCSIKDEDLLSVVNGISSKTNYAQLFLTGTGQASSLADQADIIPLSGSHPYYNQLSGGSWLQTPMPQGYASIWMGVVAAGSDSVSQKRRISFLQPQSVSALTPAGLAEQLSLSPYSGTATIPALSFGDLADITPEFVIRAQIIIKYNGASWSIVSYRALNGNRTGVNNSTTGGSLTSVSVDGTTIVGNGTSSAPLAVNVSDDDVTISVTDEASLRAAVDSAASYSMASGKYVKIQLPAGDLSISSAITIDTRAKIKISGQAMTSTTLTSKVSNSGSTGAYSVVLGVADESIFDIDSYCVISSNITGTGSYSYFRGCYKVTAVDDVNHRITIEYPYLGTFPTATITGGTIERYTSIVTVAPENVGFLIRSSDIRMENFVITGGAQALNISFMSGFYASKFSAYKQTSRCITCYAVGALRFDSSNFMASSDLAFESGNTTTVALHSCVLIGSVYGILSNYGSNTAAASNVVVGNTTAAIAQNNSGVNLNSATYNGTLSPNGNVVGNNGSIITV